MDAKALEDLQKRVERCERDARAVVDDCLRDLTAELLRRAIDMTPRDTSNLARHWTDDTAGPDSASGSDVSPDDYAKGLRIRRAGNRSAVTVGNNTRYAPYVEYGHRTRNGKGWVPGQFMLTKAVEAVDQMKDGIVERRVKEFLGKGKK